MMNKKIVDYRESRELISPSASWIPEGITNSLYDVYANGKKVGELQIGEDGFVEILIKMPDGNLLRVGGGIVG